MYQQFLNMIHGPGADSAIPCVLHDLPNYFLRADCKLTHIYFHFAYYTH